MLYELDTPDDIPPQPRSGPWTTCPSCGCINRCNGPCKTKNCPAASVPAMAPTSDQRAPGAVRALEADPTNAERWLEVAYQLEGVTNSELLACLRQRLAALREQVSPPLDSDLELAMAEGSMAQGIVRTCTTQRPEPLLEHLECVFLREDGWRIYRCFDGTALLLDPQGDLLECPNVEWAHDQRRRFERAQMSWDMDLERHEERARDERGEVDMDGLRRLLSEGTRALTPEQTRQVRAELSAISPTTRTVRHDTWRLEVELEGRGSGEVRVVLPRDRAASGSLTWSPDGEWVDENFSQLEEPTRTANEDSNGGRAIAAAMLARLESKR